MAGSGTAQLRQRDDLVLRVEHLTVEFPAGRGAKVHAVSDLSFDVAEGETLGLVGESGCGKTSTGRAIMQLPPPTSGSVRLRNRELTALGGEELRRTRPQLQMIFQDPISSLNPRRKIRDIVAQGLLIWQGDTSRSPAGSGSATGSGAVTGNGAASTAARIDQVLTDVGLDPVAVADRRPHQFSGGQCQRICLARSLVMDPDVLICDEPVSALDVSVQAQILNLLEAMKARYGLTMVFIAHDLAVVKSISDRVAVMYLGKLCEVAPAGALYRAPAHPYTRSLLASIPRPEPGTAPSEPALTGELPSPLDPPSGCRFRTRCPRAADRCAIEEPQTRTIGPDHVVACHFPHRDPQEAR
jgi:peptide/nickel transport system ATP-binding protein